MTQALPHDFWDQALLERALCHASAGDEHNERLEFLGDAVLDLIVAERLYRAHGDVDEGVLTELKAWVVSRATLAQAASQMGLADLAQFGVGMNREALSRAVLANLYEATLGAVYLDAGLESSREFVEATLSEPLARVGELKAGPNPKQRLQHTAQQLCGEPPHYALVRERGQDHAKAFLVRARVGQENFPPAWGRTRKDAERWAAHEALLILDGREDSDSPQAVAEGRA